VSGVELSQKDILFMVNCFSSVICGNREIRVRHGNMV